MFYRYREEIDTTWAVLRLDPEIVTQIDCAFSPVNAASSTISRRPVEELKGAESFEQLYEDLSHSGKNIERSDLDLPESYPTSPQAEVLAFGQIDPGYIQEAVFETPAALRRARREIENNHTTLRRDSDVFAPRCDWEYWKSDKRKEISRNENGSQSKNEPVPDERPSEVDADPGDIESAGMSSDELFRTGMRQLTRGDFNQAVFSLHKAAFKGHSRASLILVALRAGGVVGPVDLDGAFQRLTELEDKEDPELLHTLAKHHYSRENHKEAVALTRQAAEEGYPPAQDGLGVMYEGGFGVDQDFETAVEWYRRSAEQGNPWAQRHLALKYKTGKGVPQNLQKAIRWLRKAVNQGSSKAQFRLARMYYDGEGVGQDYSKALKLYRSAARQGHAIAQNNLGAMFTRGQGVEQDANEAIRWYRKAAQQELDVALYNLGVHYETGSGVSKDRKEAIRWFRQAEKQGYPEAEQKLEKLSPSADSSEEDGFDPDDDLPF